MSTEKITVDELAVDVMTYCLLINVRIGSKGLSEANALVYLPLASTTKRKAC
jgi:hypothetical protein